MDKSHTDNPGDKNKVSLEINRLAAISSTPNGQIFCGDIDMRIARDGTWYYHGSPIERKQLVKLFGSVLSRDDKGDYWLITPVEKCRIKVDDAPFLAVEMTIAGNEKNQRLSFRTNVDDIVIAGAEHPLRIVTDTATGEPSPYILIREGIEALIARSVFYDLVEIGSEFTSDGEASIGVWSDGVFFKLGNVD
ncbi:MAG: proteophosphoglycan precursor [Rhodospirillaceae bacterium]|mgnify:CR=1 FL=1|nr:proteophosphoglycan precursor [Rhodospirillaceae bacterium]|tara:strand:- start:2104 stop:2679 length:576 start_codon:yes stop_codon:yes gene_type:complete